MTCDVTVWAQGGHKKLYLSRLFLYTYRTETAFTDFLFDELYGDCWYAYAFGSKIRQEPLMHNTSDALTMQFF